jgi:perosamine synthetase
MEYKKIYWSTPDLNDEDAEAVRAAVSSKWISQGSKVEDFENRVAQICNREFCVAVNSGGSALIAALTALGVQRGSEVIIPAMSFIAVPNAISFLGAIPVLAEIDFNTGMINSHSVKKLITKNTKGIIAIDYGGFCNDWSELSLTCIQFNIFLLVDSASSFLSKFNDTSAGSIGDAAILSFHAAKTITTGEGGAIITNNSEVAEKLREIRNYGEAKGHKYIYPQLGGNFRMTDILASIGISQVSRHEIILKKRLQIVNAYLSQPCVNKHAHPLHKNSAYKSNGWTFTIIVKNRDYIRDKLLESGVDTRIMWPIRIDDQPIYHRLPVVSNCIKEDTNRFSTSCLSLPVHTQMSVDDALYISNLVEQAVSECD